MQVVRGGTEQEIAAREIVPGDIAIVEEGQTIPADGKAGIRPLHANGSLKQTPVDPRRL